MLGEVVPPLLYADDLTLLSATKQGLQKQLDLLHQYSKEWGLTVNIQKTVVVVLQAGAEGSRREFLYAGTKLTEAKPFVYLGVELTNRGGVCSGAGAHRLSKATAAMHAMRRRAYDKAIQSPMVMCDLFESVVASTLQYGVEIWKAHHLLSNEGFKDSEQMHVCYLKHLVGVRSNTPTLTMLAEFGRFPLACCWAKHCARYWQRLVDMEETRLVKAAFLASWEMAQHQNQQTRTAEMSWCFIMAKVFEQLGVSVVDQSGNFEYVDADVVQAALQRKHLDTLNNSTSSKVKDYLSVIRGGAIHSYEPQPYMKSHLKKHVKALAQFRTGSHWLRLETGRFEAAEDGESRGRRRRSVRLERPQRVCQHCNNGQVEDENHMLFHCSRYDTIKQQYGDLFTVPNMTVKEFLEQQQPPGRVASYVYKCKMVHVGEEGEDQGGA